MSKQTGRTRPSTAAIRDGRLKKATEFLNAAALVEDTASDAAMNLYVLAGIAAADVICCARLGKYAAGENHNDAVALLNQADSTLGKHLQVLLNIKSKVAYTHQSASPDERKKARRAAEALGEAARRTALSG